MSKVFNKHLGDFEALFNQEETQQKINLLIVKHKSKLTPGISQDDMRSAAYIGLFNAYKRYTPEKSDLFMKYAYQMMEGHIRHLLRDNNPGLNYPRSVKEIHGRIKKLDLTEKTPEEISDITGFNVSEIKLAIEYRMNRLPMELDRPVQNENEEETTLVDSIQVYEDYSGVLVNEFMSYLTEEERTIASLLVEGKTRMDIAREIGSYIQRVQRIVERIREKANQFVKAEKVTVVKRGRPKKGEAT